MKKKKPKFTGSRALAELETMKHKDLQRACIVRGMDFEEVIESTTPQLSNWFVNNFQRSQDSTLLNTFDAFIEIKLQQRGYKKGDAILSPELRLGYLGPVDETTGKTIIRRISGISKTVKKRERDDSGLFTGTKKSLTFQLAKEGKTLVETLEIVTGKFPEAVEKSIKIWFKKALKTV